MGEHVETTLHHAITATGQLVYCCALIHAPIMFGYFYSRDQPLYYQAGTMVKERNGQRSKSISVDVPLVVLHRSDIDCGRSTTLTGRDTG